MVGIRDVAHKAGVSIATVSATINRVETVREETRERVHAAIAALGYQPNGVARSLRLGSSGIIGLVVSEISNPFFSEIYRVVEEVALGAGKVVLVCNTNELCERENLVLRALRAQRIAGLIIAPAGQGNEYGIELASRIPHRTVVIDRHIPFLERDFVCLDNRAAGRMIAEYLLRLGHRRIGFIGGREGVSTAVERFEGFAGALRDGGATLDPSLCIDANYRSELANRAAVEMLTRTDRPSAIVAANNLTTLGVMQAVSALGFDCPNDVSVGGIDDSPWNIALRPPLTSVAQPIQAIGRQAIDWLIERLSNPVDIAPRSVAFAPALVIRDSCSAV
jgi:LacI family transcriptional regulator